MAKSWVTITRGSHFSLANLPFGIVSHTGSKTPPGPSVAIGDYALHLQLFAQDGGFAKLNDFLSHLDTLAKPTLNDFAALGRAMTGQVRKYLQRIFAEETEFSDILKDNKALQARCLFPLKDVTAHMPFHIGDYTDFYVGKHHAYNVGVLFRGPKNALQPNYTHLPVGYHGRASSVVISGTPIRRPRGQILADPAADPQTPIFSPSRRLDFELELGAFIATGNKMGDSIPISKAADHLFGYVLMNDWSARDIQAWEYVPLGPFNAKNFGTTISSWVVHVDALEPFRTKGIANDHAVLDYLQERDEPTALDIKLEVDLKTHTGNTTTISRSNSRNMLFSFSQMLTHHCVGGCPMQTGDLLGSGTLTGERAGSEGCLLEQTQGGKSKVQLEGGEERTFLEDGDSLVLRGWAGDDEFALVGFGDCAGTIQPAPVE